MSEKVRSMFGSIAESYDRINRILSLGIDQMWRKRAVKESAAKSGEWVLDCATGTGDLAMLFKKVVGPSGRVLGTDFSPEMISYAPGKAQKANLEIEYEVADTLALPYESNQYDIASIAFGIRNVDDPVLGLQEMARVCKPGGRVMVLEFGQPKGLFGALYRFYSYTVMPTIGGWLSGNREAYVYLPETSAAFPAGDDFLALMSQSKAFSSTRAVKLSGGIAYVYVGTVAN